MYVTIIKFINSILPFISLEVDSNMYNTDYFTVESDKHTFNCYCRNMNIEIGLLFFLRLVISDMTCLGTFCLLTSFFIIINCELFHYRQALIMEEREEN